MQDSGQYIQNQDLKFVIKYPAFRQRLNVKVMLQIVFAVICLVFLSGWNLLNRQINKIQINHNSSHFQKYVYIIEQTGTRFRLKYQKPIQINPQKIVPQPTFNALIKLEQNQLQPKQHVNQQQFNSKLFLNWRKNQQIIFIKQYAQLHQKYDLDSFVQQSSLCIISPYRNLVSGSSQQSWQYFLMSVNSQNYSNYHVFMIDDVSTDGSAQQIIKKVRSNYTRLNNRLTIVRNTNRTGALGNRDIAVRNYCKPKDIVIDVDGDDALIGKQVFNTINRIYKKNQNAWFVYSNYLSIMGNENEARQVNFKNKMNPGISKPINEQIFRLNRYRAQINQWVTSQLRTYMRDLYVKIPFSYVIEEGSRAYYVEASDRFSMYALSELAGKNHTIFIKQYFYFYFEPNFLVLQKKKCTLPQLFFNQAMARVLTPLLPLNQLNDQVKVTPDYNIPTDIISYYIRKQQKYLDCIQKQRKKQKKKE